MTKRQHISKKTRFEVFKRDKFTCQYCGAKAPDVVLQVDHIRAVAAGGLSDILNLITSCVSCNGGKGARPLDQNTELERQRAQLEDLEERRQQIEMLLEWRNGLSDLKARQVEAIERRVCDEFGWHALTEAARNQIRKWLRESSLDELIECFEIAVERYLEFGKDGSATEESKNKAFTYIPRIASVRRGQKKTPWLQDKLYTLGIMRNRMYVGQPEASDLLTRAFQCGADPDWIKDIARKASNWTNWREEMQEFVEDLEANSR